MKKIKVYIVTYKRPDILHNTLEYLFGSDFSQIENTEVTIINNHSEFSLKSDFEDKVQVLHNMTRPDFSTGNLSKNWNEALINGFCDLNNPDSEIVVHLQNDVKLDPCWCSHLLQMHEKYTFITGFHGDSLVSYKAAAVKKIGLWDERLCGICHKEADYWLRAMIFNREKSSINDEMHGRLLNHDEYLPLDTARITTQEAARYKNEAHYSWELAIRVFYLKWKDTWKEQPQYEGWLLNWTKEFVDNPPSAPKINTYMSYPYFEKDIENLIGKKYAGF